VNNSATPGRRPSGLPYPFVPPTQRDELPELRGSAGAPASWGLRAMARIIDFVVVSFPFGFLTAAAGVKFVQKGPDKGDLIGPGWTLLLFPLFFMAYEVVLISRFGQTLGKWVCQIKVVDWETGELPTVSESITRAVVPGIFLLAGTAAPLIGISIIGFLQFAPIVIYLSSLGDRIYRGWHDKAATTIVLAAPRPRRTGGRGTSSVLGGPPSSR